MVLTSNDQIIIFSSIIILSYFFNFISGIIKIPSVLLLLILGISLKSLAQYFHVSFVFPQNTLELMGTFGLILIVLEASLELKITKGEISTVRNSFFAALIIFTISSIFIALIFKFWLGTTYQKSLINAIPLAVVSSAIAIPGVSLLSKRIREFIVYEATFSDIIGIMAFYYLIQDNISNISTIGNFGIKLVIIILVSLAGSLLLLFLINKINSHVKFFLILSILILIYSTGKIFHLPSLLLVLVFGLLISNCEKILKGQLSKVFNAEKLQTDIINFKTITEESAFLVRTFFFVLFGFSINLEDLLDSKIILTGLSILIVSLAIRYVYLRFTVKETDRITKLFLAPRGLVTVLLFYSIPQKYIIPEVSIGIVFFIILVSGFMMAISLWIGDTSSESIPQETEALLKNEEFQNKEYLNEEL